MTRNLAPTCPPKYVIRIVIPVIPVTNPIRPFSLESPEASRNALLHRCQSDGTPFKHFRPAVDMVNGYLDTLLPELLLQRSEQGAEQARRLVSVVDCGGLLTSRVAGDRVEEWDAQWVADSKLMPDRLHPNAAGN